MTLKHVFLFIDFLLVGFGGFLVGAVLLPQRHMFDFCAWLLTGFLVAQLFKEAATILLKVITARRKV